MSEELQLGSNEAHSNKKRTQREQSPDPGKVVCGIQVKLADLGNACWTVERKAFELLINLKTFFCSSIIIIRMIFKRDNTELWK